MAAPFAVRRRDPVLVGPAAPTPRGTRRLSDLDDQDTLRNHETFVMVYRGRPAAGGGGDPAAVIRRALAEALVPYHPLAGRLREAEGRKLVVDCTGEGVLFAEADAGVRLELVEAAGLAALFPWLEQLMCSHVQGSSDLLDCPLLHVQVTRFLCGGFVFAIRLNHTMCDAVGLIQFIAAVAKLARGRGLPSPAAAAPWDRELLSARATRRPAFPHREFEAAPLPPPLAPAAAGDGDMVVRCFSFSPADIAALKGSLQPRLARSTVFDVLAAFLWRARTAALALPPDGEVRLVVPFNVRFVEALRLPAGYYGNACVPAAAAAPAGALCRSSLGEVVELLRRAKEEVTAEYARSVADVLVLRRRPHLAKANLLVLSDVRRVGFDRVDFGWGKPVYGGPTAAAASPIGTFIVGVKNGGGGGGEDTVIVVPLRLPRQAMERFALEVESTMGSLRSHSRL